MFIRKSKLNSMERKMNLIIDIQTTTAPGVEDSFYTGWAMKRGSRTPEEALSKAGIHAEFGFICGIAILPVETPRVQFDRVETKTAADPVEEEKLLEWLLDKTRDKDVKLVGHNIKGFDIPYLVKRFIAHGYIIPDFLQSAIHENSYIDLMQELACNGGSLMSLRATAYMLGIEDPLSATDPQRSVYELHQSGNLKAIAEIGKTNAIVTGHVYQVACDSNLIYGSYYKR